MPSTRLALLALMLIATPLLALEYQSPKGFTIHLDDTWQEIPRAQIDELIATAHRLAPNLPRQMYEVGFQPVGESLGDGSPYILIQIQRTGKIPRRELESMQSVQQSLEKGLEQIKEQGRGLTERLESGEMIYDPALDTLFTHLKMGEGESAVQTFMAMKLTEFGSINLLCYTREAEMPAYEPTFRKIVAEMTLDPRIAYGASGLGPAAIGLLIGGILGAVAAAIGILKRMNRNT